MWYVIFSYTWANNNSSILAINNYFFFVTSFHVYYFFFQWLWTETYVVWDQFTFMWRWNCAKSSNFHFILLMYALFSAIIRTSPTELRSLYTCASNLAACAWCYLTSFYRKMYLMLFSMYKIHAMHMTKTNFVNPSPKSIEMIIKHSLLHLLEKVSWKLFWKIFLVYY